MTKRAVRIVSGLVFLFALTGPARVLGQDALFLDYLSLGGLVITPSMKVGYQKMGLNVDIPVPAGPVPAQPPIFGLSALNGSFKDTGMWVFSGRLALQYDDLVFFAGGEANAGRRTIGLFESHPMIQLAGLNRPVEMDGLRMRWWMFETGFGYELSNGLFLIAALRMDQLKIIMGDARIGETPLTPTLSDYIGGEFFTSALVPYIGVNLSSGRWSCSLNWSPFAHTELKAPWRSLDFVSDVSEQASYVLSRPAAFLEAKLDFLTKPRPNMHVGVWAKASWLGVHAKGKEQLTTREVGFPPVNEERSGGGSIARSQLSLGISAVWAF